MSIAYLATRPTGDRRCAVQSISTALARLPFWQSLCKSSLLQFLEKILNCNLIDITAICRSHPVHTVPSDYCRGVLTCQLVIAVFFSLKRSSWFHLLHTLQLYLLAIHIIIYIFEWICQIIQTSHQQAAFQSGNKKILKRSSTSNRFLSKWLLCWQK